MLATRILSALVLIPAVGIVLYFGGSFLPILALLIFGLVHFEFITFSYKRTSIEIVGMLALAMTLPIGYVMNGLMGFVGALFLLCLTVGIWSIVAVESRRHEGIIQQPLQTLVLWLVYPGILGVVPFLYVLSRPERANIMIAWLLAVVVCSDTLAYAGGRLIGGPRLAPRISPNKTISGAICGFLFAVGCGAFLGCYFELFASPLQATVLSVVVAGLAQIGDLFESLVKRMYGVKDSGWIIPGHGGLLDRIDALLFAFPVLFIA